MCYSICCFIIFAKVEHTAKANLSPTVYYSNKIRAPHSHTRIMIAKDFLNEMKITVCCDVQKYVLTLSEVNYSLKSGWNKLKITFKIWQIKNLTECELFMFWKYPTISKIVYDDNRYYFGSLSTIKLSWSYITSDIKYQNGWLKYDHRVMYKKYTTMGCGVVERHLDMAQPTKNTFCSWKLVIDASKLLWLTTLTKRPSPSKLET